MKLNVLGVKRIKGISSEAKGSNPFDMCMLFGLVPVENGGSKNVKISGYGFETAEMKLQPEAMESFAGLKFPCVLELETDSVPFMGKFETVVCGYKPLPAAVKAA